MFFEDIMSLCVAEYNSILLRERQPVISMGNARGYSLLRSRVLTSVDHSLSATAILLIRVLSSIGVVRTAMQYVSQSILRYDLVLK